MVYYVKNGPTITLILNERFTLNGDKIEGKKGTKFLSFEASDFTAINVTEEKKSFAGNKEFYTITDGIPKLMTITQINNLLAGKAKANAIHQAEALYKTLKADRTITVDDVEYDLNDTFEFDFQRRGGGNVRVKLKNGKAIQKTKQETDALETALFTRLNDIADAFDLDMDNIEAGDYSLTNLKALER